MAAATYDSNPNSAPSYSAPLLRTRQEDSPTRRGNGAGTAPLAVLLGRVTGRRGASMLVRETAARELEERRADWGYSKPVVALDIMWNLAFVIVSIVMLLCTLHEKPNAPIRVWIGGYALQCLVHVVLVWVEYRRRNWGISNRMRAANMGWDEESGEGAGAGAGRNDGSEDEEDSVRPGILGITSRTRLVFHFFSLF